MADGNQVRPHTIRALLRTLATTLSGNHIAPLIPRNPMHVSLDRLGFSGFSGFNGFNGTRTQARIAVQRQVAADVIAADY